VGAWGRIKQGELKLDGLVASLDGKQVLRASASGPSSTAMQIGRQVAEALLAQSAQAIIEQARGV
jgi:hydroxymethylbilane synthase